MIAILRFPTDAPLAVQSLLAVEKRMEDIVFPRPDDESDRRACPKCGDATLYLRISGAAGGFVACANYLRSDDGIKCTYRRRLLPGEDDEINAPDGGQDLGLHPETGNEVQLKEGPYGWCGLLRLRDFCATTLWRLCARSQCGTTCLAWPTRCAAAHRTSLAERTTGR